MKWRLHPKGGPFRRWYGNVDLVINWSEEAREFYRRDKVARILPEYLWNRPGISWNLVTISEISFRILDENHIFNKASPSLFFHDVSLIPVCLGLLNTKFIAHVVKILNPTVNMNVKEIRTIPFDEKLVDKKTQITTIVESCISIFKDDWDSYETSWNFGNLLLLRNDYRKETLERTYKAVRSYWQNMIETAKKFEEENNQIFIENYNLQDEFTSNVPLDEISLTCNPYFRYGGKKTDEELETILCIDTIKEFISYSVGCMFGRYSLDKPGLILANQGETLQDYLRQIPDSSFLPDEDNTIPILDGDWFNDDISERFKQFLRVTFGEEHFDENLAFIEKAIGRDIRSYFLKDFYANHIQMYKKRPIYWLFSSPRGSFNVLIYMHRYNRDTGSVVLKYLRDFHSKLEARKSYLEQISISASAEPREKTAALKEIQELDKKLEEMRVYERDILFPLAAQHIEIDLDDGVKVNYPKFGKALAPKNL